METEIVPGYAYQEDVKKMIAQYTQMLIDNHPGFEEYLALQSYGDELENLQAAYGPPHGRLLVALVDGTPAGCVALKKLEDGACEMKRLYVLPQYMGQGLAQRLVERLIGQAEAIGYSAVLLDTMPFLKGAIHLYKRLGFYEVGCYNNSPLADTIYMKRDLG